LVATALFAQWLPEAEKGGAAEDLHNAAAVKLKQRRAAAGVGSDGEGEERKGEAHGQLG
jgi:hypothetical protein